MKHSFAVKSNTLAKPILFTEGNANEFTFALSIIALPSLTRAISCLALSYTGEKAFM